MKICPGCQTECKDESRFCTNCGTRLPDAAEKPQANAARPMQPTFPPKPMGNNTPGGEERFAPAHPFPQREESRPTPVQEEFSWADSEDAPVKPPMPSREKRYPPQKKGMPTWLAAVACLAVLVCAVVLVVPNLGGSGADIFDGQEHSIQFLYDPDGQLTTIVYDSTVREEQIEGYVSGYYTSLDGSGAAALTEEGTLYWVDQGTMEQVAENVTDMMVSEDASTLVYLVDHAMYRWDTASGEEIRLGNGVDSFYGGTVYDYDSVISPSGDSILYRNGVRDALYLHCKGESIQIGEDGDSLYPVAVSNKGNYVYYYKAEFDGTCTLYVTSGEVEDSIKLIGDLGSIWFNEDRSQVCFTGGDKSVSYFSIKGQERMKIVSGLFPNSVLYCLNNTGNGYNTLCNQAYKIFTEEGSMKLLYVDSQYEVYTIAREVDYTKEVVVRQNHVFYVKDGDLYRTDMRDSDDSQVIASDVQRYAVTADGAYVYYTDSDDVLWCTKNGGEPGEIDDEVSSLWLNEKGIYYLKEDYTSYEGTLYRSVNGKKKERISEHVCNCKVMPRGVMYTTRVEGNSEKIEYWISGNGSDFEKIPGTYYIYY